MPISRQLELAVLLAVGVHQPESRVALPGAAALAVSPLSLHFGAAQGSVCQPQPVQIGGTAGIAWQAAATTGSDGSRLSLSAR